MTTAKPPVIAGKFTLLRKLGAGGMAEVFLAKQTSAGNFEKLVVLKRILPQLASGTSNTDFVAMFLDEARLASDLRHPNIVTVTDVGKTGDTYYIVMEFLHGQDVRKMQRKNAAWSEVLPLGHCCQIAIDAAAGLHYAHNKVDLTGTPLHIVHRDVSPQNIVITYEGVSKIVDFGIAKAATQTTHTSTGVLKGKYTYMSPEQAAGESVDARTDQFALGIVLWELLTMRRLFKRDNEQLTLEAIMHGQVPRPSRFRSDLPKSIDDIVAKALMRRREDRFATCEELALALEDALSKEGIVHSHNRLAQFMRRLFADVLAEEATLGLVNPDGSVSRNLTRFTLPPVPAERPHGEDSYKIAAEAPAEVTTPEGKRLRGKDDSAPRPEKPRKRSLISDSVATEVTLAEQRVEAKATVRDQAPRDQDDAHDRAIAVPVVIASRPLIALLAAGLLGAGLVMALYLAWSRGGVADVIVRSTPKGAAVSLDGKPTGDVTPALLKGLEVGSHHKIRVELPGKAPVDEIVTIQRRGETLELKLDIP